MTQFYTGKGDMIPDQQFGFWVRKDDFQRELSEQATKFSEIQGQKENTFFNELDRLEKTNKQLHAKVKELEEAK